MIDRLLGEPDRKIVLRSSWDTPRSASRPECVYEESRVRLAEESPEFQAWSRRLKKRRAGPNVRPWPWIDRSRKCCELRAYGDLSRRDKRIVRLLFDKVLPQREVARRVGVSQQTVSLIRLKFLAAL